MAITLYHKELDTTVEVPDEGAASVLEQSGWTTKVPKDKQPDSDEPKEA